MAEPMVFLPLAEWVPMLPYTPAMDGCLTASEYSALLEVLNFYSLSKYKCATRMRQHEKLLVGFFFSRRKKGIVS